MFAWLLRLAPRWPSLANLMQASPVNQTIMDQRSINTPDAGSSNKIQHVLLKKVPRMLHQLRTLSFSSPVCRPRKWMEAKLKSAELPSGNHESVLHSNHEHYQIPWVSNIFQQIPKPSIVVYSISTSHV